MIDFNKNKLDEWLDNFEEFNYDFRRFCFVCMKVYGVYGDFIPNTLKQIHEQWVESHQDWLDNEIHESTTELSHLKICALLLYALCSEPFFGNLYEHEYHEDIDYSFNGPEELFEKAKQDLIDGREAIVALDFCTLIINWFEANRIDKSSPYTQRMTEDMRHDILSYLVADAFDRKSIYLILKALYLRPSDEGPSN
ncbi:hypothetical protein ROS1_28660 [Roseibium sp. ROS1]